MHVVDFPFYWSYYEKAIFFTICNNKYSISREVSNIMLVIVCKEDYLNKQIIILNALISPPTTSFMTFYTKCYRGNSRVLEI